MNEYRGHGSAAPGLRRVSGVATVAGAAFLTSGVWAIVAEVVGHAESLRPPRSED
ncbi:hypothetical protein [Actinophytocola glycyrrhizae]|uniref:Uncharacterized protein n=1 Tax=Actinophytocola glycyrrhizae TaxID=2044873 RepID=A0ABV9S3S8_9PSEU